MAQGPPLCAAPNMAIYDDSAIPALAPARGYFGRMFSSNHKTIGLQYLWLAIFSVFLFLIYYLQLTLGYSAIKSGFALLPMIGTTVVTASVGQAALMPFSCR